MTRASSKVLAIVLLAVASILVLPVAAGAAPAASPSSFTLSMPDGGGTLHIHDAASNESLSTPTTITGTVDPTTGAISGASFSTPTISFQQNITSPVTATVYIDASFSEVTPNSATGSIDSDGNVILQDAMTVSLHIEVGNPAFLTADCQATPVNLTLQSTAPYDPDKQSVTLADTNFTVPEVQSSDSCSSLIQGAINKQLAGDGNSLSITFNGALPVPAANDNASATTLAVTPAGGSRLGNPVTMNATVAPGEGNDSDTAPTGFVDFLDGTTTLATEPVVDGAASFTTSAMVPGDHTLTAKYRGDSNYAPSSSAPVTYSVAATPSVKADLPAYVESGGAAAPFDLTVTNPAAGAAVDNARVDITITPKTGYLGTLDPTNVTLEQQAGDGSWSPIALQEPTGQTLVGSVGAATGEPLAAGATLTDHLRLSATADPGALNVTFELLPVDPAEGTPAPVPAPASAALASASGVTTLVPADRVATTMTIGLPPLFPGLSPPLVRQGYTAYLLPLINPKPYGNPTGTLRAYIDGEPALVRAVKGSRGFTYTAPIRQIEVQIPTTVAIGNHQITIAYSGDAIYLPSEASTTIQVVRAAGTPYLCSVSAPGGLDLFGANVVAHANLPAAVASGSDVNLDHLDISVLTGRSNKNLQAFGPGLAPGWNQVGSDALTAVSFGFGPDGTGTATEAQVTGTQMNTPDPDNPDATLEFGGETGSVTINGAPGTTVPVTVGTISITTVNGTVPLTLTCTPADKPATLGTVTVAGTSLKVTSKKAPAVAGGDVTLTATVAPADAGGTVEFRDGDTAIAVVPVSDDGTATFTTSNLAAGTHHLTAVWSGTLTLPTATSDPVDFTVYPDVTCPTDAVAGSSATVRWVYLSLLGRCPDAGGFAYWTGRLDDGDSPAAVANALTHSGEAVRRVVNQAYESALGRQADKGGLAFWSGKVSSGQLGEQDLLVQLVSSHEFFTSAGGTADGYVAKAYQVLLGRTPDDTGKAYWVDRVTSGTSRATVAHAIAFSHEAATRIVSDAYRQELQQVPEGDALAAAVAAFQADSSVPNLLARIIGSKAFTTFAQTFPDLPAV